jgi:hypothetical protein
MFTVVSVVFVVLAYILRNSESVGLILGGQCVGIVALAGVVSLVLQIYSTQDRQYRLELRRIQVIQFVHDVARYLTLPSDVMTFLETALASLQEVEKETVKPRIGDRAKPGPELIQ